MTCRSANFVSLFSGCGGFDLGFMQAGFRGRMAFDHDSDAVLNFRQNVGDHAHLRDLVHGIPNDHCIKGIDTLIAGPPCQGFSTIGKRRLDDDRNSLLPLVGVLAKRILPRVVVVENVAGVIAGKHIRYWEFLTEILRASGFRTHTLSCQATQLGMAQLRKRLFLIAWRTGREASFLLPHNSPSTLKDALRGVNGLPNHKPQKIKEGSNLWIIAARIGQGQKLSNVRGGPRAVHTWDIPEVYGPTTEHERTLLELLLRLRRQNRVRSDGDADPVSIDRLSEAFGAPFRKLLRSLIGKGHVRYKGQMIDIAHTFNGKCRRMAWDLPSCAVDTRFGDARYFLHPVQPRGFSVREAARIQGFPDDFIFHGEIKAQYRLIGNAVPPPMANMVATFVNHLLGILS